MSTDFIKQPDHEDHPPTSPTDQEPKCEGQLELPFSISPAESFLKTLWASSDLFHTLALRDSSSGFTHIDVSDVASAAGLSTCHARNGADVFFACSEYGIPQSRRAENARCARALWLDIDVGTDKATSSSGYATLSQAEDALTAFCRSAGLPSPTYVVHSGGGLHVYWCFDTAIPRDVWRIHAGRLKALAKAHGLRADPSRTSDVASLLRVPGTLNYKYDPPAAVTLKSAAAVLSFEDFASVVEAEHARVATAGSKQSAMPNIAKLTAALRELDPDCDEPTWTLRRIAPLAAAARETSTLAVPLEELARSWSSGALRGKSSSKWATPSQSSGRSGKEVFSEVWARFRDSNDGRERTTLATIFFDAKKAGWREDATTQSDLCPETHNGYATDLIKRLAVEGHRPIGHSGRIFVVDTETCVWRPQTHDAVVRSVSETYDGRKGCTRRADYLAIAAQAVSLVDSPEFFDQAPAGLACVQTFYRVDKGAVLTEPLTPDHRQRVLLPFEPAQQPTPRFDQFLHDTFASGTPSEEQEQIRLVQEIAGATMLGVMARLQKAVVFYDPYGRAGKGTLESILRCLVPSPFVTAVSPFNWDQEYFLATLAGSRLNVVGELPSDRPLPGAAFKSVIGRDLQTGRNPTQVPFTFRNEAAHIFMSNHFIGTKDQSEAFFARWLIVEFPNSLLRSGKPVDPGLADSIVATELPGIAAWALEGGRRLLEAQRFSPSLAHERLMTRWRRSSNSLEEFIAECCELDLRAKTRRSLLYQLYKAWCGENGRKPFAKATVKGLLEHNIGLGISLAVLDGHEIFRGVRLKEEYAEEPTI